MLLEKIKTLAKKYADEFIAIRHHLHANPELSYEEFETAVCLDVCCYGFHTRSFVRGCASAVCQQNSRRQRLRRLRLQTYTVLRRLVLLPLLV